MDPILERYQALEDKIKEYNPALDAQRLFRAFTYATTPTPGHVAQGRLPLYSPTPWPVADDRSGAGAGHRLHHRRPAPRLHRGHRGHPRGDRQALRTHGGRSGGGGHQADPGAVHLQGRGADGEPAQDAHGHGQGHPGDPHQNLRPAAQHAHHGVPERPQAEGEGPGNHGDLRAHRPPPGHAAHQVGAGGPVLKSTLDPIGYEEIVSKAGGQAPGVRGLPCAASRSRSTTG